MGTGTQTVLISATLSSDVQSFLQDVSDTNILPDRILADDGTEFLNYALYDFLKRRGRRLYWVKNTELH